MRDLLGRGRSKGYTSNSPTHPFTVVRSSAQIDLIIETQEGNVSPTAKPKSSIVHQRSDGKPPEDPSRKPSALMLPGSKASSTGANRSLVKAHYD